MGASDGSFLKELFLQRLLANVWMVLVLTSDTTILEELAQLADKIVELAAPSVSAVAASSFAEMEQLRSEVISLKKLVQSLSSAPQHRRPFFSRGHSTSPAHPRSPADAPSAGTTRSTVRMPRSAAPLVPCPTREMRGLGRH